INPAVALEDLCRRLGCVPVLDPLLNVVRVCPLGVGALLPAGGVDTASLAITPPERPDGLLVVCGPTRWQTDLVLEAIGLDLDDTYKLLDDLSYKPSVGWGADPQKVGFPNVLVEFGEDAQRRAVQSVFRYYRVKAAMPDGTDG